MGVQLSVAVRNARLDAIETVVGTAPVLFLKTGAQASSCAQATSDGHAANGTKIASITLPSDWAAAASGGVKAKSGTWEDTSSDAAGTLGHYELWDSGLTACHEQGSITITGGGGNMTVDNTVVQAGQDIIVTAWSKTDGNA